MPRKTPDCVRPIVRSACESQNRNVAERIVRELKSRNISRYCSETFAYKLSFIRAMLTLVWKTDLKKNYSNRIQKLIFKVP